MAYTWEDVMLGIDVKNEQARKIKQQEEIMEMQKKEATAAGWWKMGLSFLGGAIFGPAGYFLGKQLGEYGTDLAYDWEDMEVEEGKFNTAGAKQFNKTLKEAAKDQTQGQVLNTILDVGKMYVQAGGLTAEPGELDYTTFGAGGAEGGEWSAFGRGEEGTMATTGTPYIDPTTGAELTPVIPGIEPSADYVPSIWDREGSLLSNVGKVVKTGQGMIAQDQSLSTIGNLAQQVYQAKQEVKS